MCNTKETTLSTCKNRSLFFQCIGLYTHKLSKLNCNSFENLFPLLLLRLLLHFLFVLPLFYLILFFLFLLKRVLFFYTSPIPPHPTFLIFSQLTLSTLLYFQSFCFLNALTINLDILLCFMCAPYIFVCFLANFYETFRNCVFLTNKQSM